MAKYSEVTNGVEVVVEPTPLPESSHPRKGKYAFSYRVTIKNGSDQAVRLLERYWLVKSGGERIAEVIGPGVVGEQPVIEVGAEYRYESGAIIQDPVGSMEGNYTFRSTAGKFFQAHIPRFDLLFSSALN